MSYREVQAPSARGQIQFRFASRAGKVLNVFQCLIVSAEPARREMLERAASEGGWKTAVCDDPTSALTYLNRTLVQMAVVDLESQKLNAFRPVVEHLTSRSGVLLIVCGNEGDIEEEVWVRQLGAWLYLPGVMDPDGFSSLCSEARHIAERLAKPSAPDRAPVSQGGASAVVQRKSYS